MDKILLTIPKKSKYVSVVRLTTSAISNIRNLTIDDIEDLKVILSEICGFFINNIIESTKPFEIEYNIFEDKLKVKVKDLNNGPFLEKEKEDTKMCILIIESLADKFEINYQKKEIIFEKKIV